MTGLVFIALKVLVQPDGHFTRTSAQNTLQALEMSARLEVICLYKYGLSSPITCLTLYVLASYHKDIDS
jgi:hypothetical protein